MKEITAVELLELVKNPDKYAEKLKELEDSRKAFQEVVEQVGPAGQIPVMHKAAQDALEAAKADAAKKIEIAEHDAEEIRAAAKAEMERAQNLKHKLGLQLDESAAKARDLVGRELEIKNKEKELEAALVNAKDAMEAAEKLRSEYQEKLEKLRSVL